MSGEEIETQKEEPNHPSESDADGSSTSIDRRSVMKQVVGGAVSASLVGTVAATGSTSPKLEETTVESNSAKPMEAWWLLNKASGDLLAALEEDGLLSTPYHRQVPTHAMEDDLDRGGIEKLRISTPEEERQNVLIHNETDDGGRLTLRLPIGDREASAEYVSGEEPRIVGYDASGERKERKFSVDKDTTVSSDEVTTASCENDCTFWCTCGVCPPTTYTIREPCPNCWLPWDSCKTAENICDGCVCDTDTDPICQPK